MVAFRFSSALFVLAAILPAQVRSLVPHVPDPLAHWRAARASGTATIAVIGDSISEGDGTVYPNGYVDLLKKHFRDETGDAGYGYLMPHVISASGYWALATDYAPLGNGIKGTAGAKLMFSANSVIDAVKVFYAGMPDSAPFSVSIDNQPPVLVTAIQPGVNEARFPVATGDHAVTITAPDAGCLYFIGASVERGNTGVRVHNLSHYGRRAHDASYGTRMDILNILKPDLTILAIGVNDRGLDVSDYTQAMLSAIRKAQTFGSVLIVTENPNTDTAVLPDGIAARPPIIDVDQVLTDSTGSFRIDMFDAWGGTWKTANALGFMSADRVHPSSAGHQNYADTILKVTESAPRITRRFNMRLARRRGTNGSRQQGEFAQPPLQKPPLAVVRRQR